VTAFIKDGRVPALHGSGCGLVLFLIVPITALFAVIVSQLGAKIRAVTVPFDADSQMRDADNLIEIESSNFSLEYILAFHRERLTYWTGALKSIREAIDVKAKWVDRGHSFMLAALTLLIVLCAVVILRS
jgi:hypothetical protein